MNRIVTETAKRNAVILAAGFGMRMVPINTMYTKGMLEVHGEPLIERLICQLHEADIREIYIIVGFMKEAYEYLIDKYHVQLIINPEYMEKNNLYSLYRAEKYLKNTYIIPCDVWCRENPFLQNKPESWYMISDMVDDESIFRVNRKREISVTSLQKAGNGMIGIAYVTEKDSALLRKNMHELIESGNYQDSFWEDALIQDKIFMLPARIVSAIDIVEINTYEQLRELDENSNHLKSEALALIAQVLHVEEMAIKNITVLKKGMTNRSFLFSCNKQRYIMRIPGEGTDQLINRREEAEVYDLINGKKICDEIIYINSENGYKITKYLSNARVCDAENNNDLEKCMEKLHWFHNQKLILNHKFDIFNKINFYESLWQHKNSIYRDYQETKSNIFSLKAYIASQPIQTCLTHIDAVPDNFLFYQDSQGIEQIRLIDWEYAAMQDPHVDIAMFCIYALYNRKQIDNLIDIYFHKQCDENTRTKIYCYIAICGLLWSNWCEYKLDLGIEFGEYSLCQYRYAKDFYKIATKRITSINGGEISCIM